MRVLTLVMLVATVAIASPAMAEDISGADSNSLYIQGKPADDTAAVRHNNVSDANPGIDSFSTASIGEVIPADRDRARARKFKRALMLPTGMSF